MLPSIKKSARIVAAVLAVAATSGCAQERKAINKVQADALDKSFFVGDPGNPSDDPEFYWRNYVVDGSESQELIGIGDWSGVDRIRWEITESKLFARRAYPQGDGADNKGGPGFPDGTIIAAYPIVSHFDVRRAYNPQTGEDLNIIEENTTDRPWYQRDHFRVDWSMNQVDTPQWTDMFVGKLLGDIEITPIAYYVSDANHDDAPHFDAKGGYFDITSKFLVAPKGSGWVWGDGTAIPHCVLLGFLSGTAALNCDAQEAVVRSSYLKVDQVDPDGDFEPFENTRAQLDIFGNPGGIGDSISAGIVTPPRLAWDPGYGYVDDGMKRFMHVHNVWKQSHQTRGRCSSSADCGGGGSVCLASKTCSVPCSYGGRLDENRNGTDDRCENADTGYRGSEGSQCSARSRCTIPYRDREIEPVAWWINRETPDALQDTLDSSGKVVRRGPTEDVVYTWNQAVSVGIAHAREVECRRTGGVRAECHAEFFTGETEMVSFGGWGIPEVKNRVDVMVTCHNPVRDYDPDECGAENTTARLGDLRRNFLNYWPYSSRVPWGGIANWNADPLTGQIVGAAATTMGRSATGSAAQIRDILLVANGNLDIDQITDGVPAALFQQRLRTGEPRHALTVEEVNRRMAGVDVQGARAAFGFDFKGTTPRDRLFEALAVRTNTTTDPRILSSIHAEFDALARPVQGSTFEAQLIDSSWIVDAAGLDPGTPTDPSLLARVSPFQGRDSARMNLAMQGVLQRMNQRGVCLLAPGEGVGNPDIRGLARYFLDPDTGLYGGEEQSRQAELVYEHLWKQTYKGIALHEVGHALGMLHNFASSYDAANYSPQYWQLRTNEGQAMESCGGQPRPEGEDTCMGPRFFDPETADELGQADEPRPGINYFGDTSTMEYHNERFFETIGLGQYDLMTMGALYGRVLETFDAEASDGVPAGEQQTLTWLSLSQLIDVNLVDAGPVHYTELGRQIRAYDSARCRDATAEEKEHAEWRIVHGKVCAPPPKDYAAWDDFIDDDLGGGNLGTKIFASPDVAGGTGNVRWPYRFGTSFNAYTHTNPFDSGADAYEITREAIRKFDYSYPFTYFRRRVRDWNYEALPSYTATRFFERLRSYHWVFARANALGTAVSSSDALPTDDVERSERLAEIDIFNAVARAILTPQIGAFTRNDELQPGLQLYDASNGGFGVFSLDAATARFVDPDYDSSPFAGGSWDYTSWIRHAGFYVEKADATRSITDPRPTLVTISRDTYLDGRAVYLNFRTDMSEGVDRLIGGILSEDWASVAPYVDDPGNPIPKDLDLTAAVPARPSTAFVLFPNLGFKQQLGTVLWGQLFSGLGTDLTLANKLRVSLEGTEAVIDVPDAEKVKFTDPRSGFTYVARRYGPDTIDGRVVDRGIGSRMIGRANELLALYYGVQAAADGTPLVDQYGRPTLSLDTAGQPVVAGPDEAGVQLANYVGLLDTTVEVTRRYGRRIDVWDLAPLPGR